MAKAREKDARVLFRLKANSRIPVELGRLNVAWGGLEFQMFRLFWYVTDLPLPMARSVFYSQRTHAARARVLSAACDPVLRKTNHKELTAKKRLDKLLGKASNLAGQRNRVVHDPWLRDDARPLVEIQMRLTQPGIRAEAQFVSASEIKRLHVKIISLARQLNTQIYRLRPKLPALRKRLDTAHNLTLVYSKTRLHPRRTPKKPHIPHQSSRP